MTSIKKEAGRETLEDKKAGKAVDGKTFSSTVSVEEPKSEDSAAPEAGEVELGRSVRWPGKLLEGDGGGAWVGISSPFPPHRSTDPFVKINPRILSSTSGAMTSDHLPPSNISRQPDLSTSEVSDLPSFPPRLPISTSNKVNSLFLTSLLDQDQSKVRDQVSDPTAEMTIYLASPLPPPAPALPLLYTYSGAPNTYSGPPNSGLPNSGLPNSGPPNGLNRGPALSVPSAVHLAPDCPGTDNVCEYRQDTYPHNLGNLYCTQNF